MFTTVKFYLAAVAAVLIAAAYWRYDCVMDRNADLETDLAEAKSSLEQSQAIITKERQNAAEVALRAQKFYEAKQHDQTELDNLRKCVADKSCGVRVVRGACPAMPSSASASGGTEATYAADRRQFEQDYFSLVASIKETKRLYEWMQQELIARSKPDYCNAKNNPAK